MTTRLYHADIVRWLTGNRWQAQNGFMPRYHAVIGDTPYFLGSIAKRFGKPDSAPAKFGTDGAFKRASNGFMGQQWDSFDDVYHYQSWVTEWGKLLLDFVHPGAVAAFFGGTRTYHRVAAGLEDAGWDIADCVMWCYGSGMPKAHESAEGYHTALKPAYEPIVIARAPRGKHTYASLLETFGSGSLSTDDTRASGRFPANFILSHSVNCNGNCAPDCPVRMLDEMSGESKSGALGFTDEHPIHKHVYNANKPPKKRSEVAYNDSGGASRFFYSAKVKNFERTAGLAAPCPHPTMKPIQLIEWLARLLLPPPTVDCRRLLVPFAGSASEMIAAHLAGWEHIDGVEMTADYIPIAQSRLDWWTRFKSYSQAESAYAGEKQDNELEENGQMRLFS